MNSYIDISFHVVISLILGYFVWKISGFQDRKSFFISLFFTILGGVLIDVDHFLDHFLSFGFNFNYDYFINGEYFLGKKAYIVFHAVEYIIITGFLAIFIKDRKKKMVFCALALGMLSHLLIDIFLFPNPIKGYFIFYRILNGFNVDMSKRIFE